MIYTDENIQENSDIVKNMTVEDIDEFKSYYAYKRNISSRPLVDARLKEIKFNEKYVEKLNKTFEHITCSWCMIQGLLIHPNPEQCLPRLGRLVSDAIHDMPHIWTGLESIKSIEARKTSKNYTPADEHFYPRQYVGETIIQTARTEKFTIQLYAKLLYKFCHVHRVTQTENEALKPYQKVYNFTTPEKSYKQVNIQLYQVCNTQNIYEPIFKEIIKLLYFYEPPLVLSHK